MYKRQVLLLLLGAAATAGWLYPGDPLEMVGAPFTWPGAHAEFPAGTDLMGRDILAGLFHGARVSLLVLSLIHISSRAWRRWTWATRSAMASRWPA